MLRSRMVCESLDQRVDALWDAAHIAIMKTLQFYLNILHVDRFDVDCGPPA
jgi:hypothetical protein